MLDSLKYRNRDTQSKSRVGLGAGGSGATLRNLRVKSEEMKFQQLGILRIPRFVNVEMLLLLLVDSGAIVELSRGPETSKTIRNDTTTQYQRQQMFVCVS